MMKKFLLLPMLFLSVTLAFTQVSYTANDQVTTYSGLFRPGINMGYYPPNYTGWDLVNIAAGNPSLNLKGIGAKTYRPALYENLAEIYGYDMLVPEFQHAQSLGMGDFTMIVGFPADWHRDHTIYCQNSDPLFYACENDPYNTDPSSCESTLFANLYTPIWDGGANGTPYNDDNYYAAYIYKLVTTYKDYVKFWEIWNEPGFDHSYVQGWQPPGAPGNWWDNDPSPCANHFHAPIEHFVRTLRISYEVIKTVDPDAYVALAGVGYESFLDAVLRNTDNPTDGSVTAEYPNKGGAYFDVMGFHTYPDIDGSVRHWDSNIMGWVYTRHSDAAAQGVITRKQIYENRLALYGYDGITYPKKEWIITEINSPRVGFNDNSMASDESQVNYIAKALVNAMKIGVRQMHPFQIADREPLANANDEFDLLGMYLCLNNQTPYDNLTKVNEGIMYKTVSDFIYGSSFDAAKTAAMNLPSNLDGAAFFDSNENRYKYILWAKTTIDLSEAASGTYSFPASFNISTLSKKTWNYSETGNVTYIPPANIALTGRPIFLAEGQDPSNGSLTLVCPSNINATITPPATTTPVSWNAPTATTTCPNGTNVTVSQTAGPASGSDFAAGTYTVTYTATDDCGNNATCSFNITVTTGSTGNLSINCPADMNLTLPAGATTMPVSWNPPATSTTCPSGTNVTVNQTGGPSSGSNLAAGTYTVTYTASDDCGNTATCSFNITVTAGSTGNLSINCPADMNLTLPAGATTMPVSWNPPATSTTCPSGTNVTVNQTGGPSSGSNLAAGTYTVTYTASDDCGNTATCSFNITVNPGSTGGGCDPIPGFTFLGEYNGHGYYLSQATMTWPQAHDLVASMVGVDLVAINDAGENDFLQANISKQVFIGLTDENDEGVFAWANGDPVTYTNYNTTCDWCGLNTPDNDYGVLLPWNGQWAFNSNKVYRSFVIETVCGGTGGGGCPDNVAGFSKLGQFGGHGYYLSDAGATWMEAQVAAELAGGYLAAINTQAENDFIQSNLGTNMVFIGFSDADSEGHPYWANGEPVTLDLSYNNNDEGDFAVMNFWAGTWDLGYNFQVVKRFVMEMDCGTPAPAPASGTAPFVSRPKIIPLTLYPNPADDLLTARILSANDDEIHCTVINIQGQSLSDTKASLHKGLNEVELDISALLPGMYFLKVTGKYTGQMVRFIKTN